MEKIDAEKGKRKGKGAKENGRSRGRVRAPSRSRKPLRLAYDSLRLASRLAVVSTATA